MKTTLAWLISIVVCAAPGRAQSPESAIRRVWSDYLASKNGQYARYAGAPSPLWVASEQRRWPMYDLAGFYLPDNAIAEVLSIRPASAGSRNTYTITTRFRAADADRSDSTAPPFVTLTVYAVRENGRWVLSNALPHRTASWEQHTVGQIHYFIEPGLHYDSARARRAVAFVDSLAAAFGAPRLGPMEYYVTSSVDAAMNILGADFPVKYGPHGAFSKPVNHQTFSGIPSLGEDYRHELTHMVLSPLLNGRTMTVLATEGIATWLGGSSGYDFPTVARQLVQYLAENPTATLDSIMESRTAPQWVTYTTGAVLCAMISDARGSHGVVEFLQAGPTPDDLRAALERLLGRPWQAIASDWRARVSQLAAP